MTRWTDEHIRILYEDYPKGVLARDIAKKVNRTPEAVCQKAQRLGLKHPTAGVPWTDGEIEILREEWLEGRSGYLIGEMLGRTQRAVQQKAQDLGMKHPFFSGNMKYGNRQRTLMYRLQDEPHCVVCGIDQYLTIHHIHHKWATPNYESLEEWGYWLNQPIEDARANLDVMCMNHNKLEAYNYYNYSISDPRQRAIERIALAHSRIVECFECGYTVDARVLEVDHLIKDKYEGRPLYWHILRMDLEEVKESYQILCSNHNRWKE